MKILIWKVWAEAQGYAVLTHAANNAAILRLLTCYFENSDARGGLLQCRAAWREAPGPREGWREWFHRHLVLHLAGDEYCAGKPLAQALT